mgnify:CR=1 FL=1
MYASDYYYVASPNAWLLVGHDSFDTTKNYQSARNMNWMYMGLLEWTISRNADHVSYVFRVLYTGIVNFSFANYACGVRPVFYLSSSVNYVSGSGTAADPIVVN